MCVLITPVKWWNVKRSHQSFTKIINYIDSANICMYDFTTYIHNWSKQGYKSSDNFVQPNNHMLRNHVHRLGRDISPHSKFVDHFACESGLPHSIHRWSHILRKRPGSTSGILQLNWTITNGLKVLLRFPTFAFFTRLWQSWLFDVLLST